MWKWLLFVILPVVLLAGGAVWYFALDRDGAVPWQSSQVEESSAPVAKTAGPALKPDQKPKPQKPASGWAVNCQSGAEDAALNCSLSQTVVMKGSRRLVTRVTLLLASAGQGPKLNIQLPLGVLIQAGTTIQVDENPPQGLRFRTCNRSGCYAETPISPAFLAQLRNGTKLVIAFKNRSEKTIKLPLPLDGFDEAYAKAQSA